MEIKYIDILECGDGSSNRPSSFLLKGDGTQSHPYWIQGARMAGTTTSILDVLRFAQANRVFRVNIAYSGRYYLYKDSAWWLTSDSESTDKIHGLPPEGKKINV